MRRYNRWGYLFIAPWAVGFVCLVAGPMLMSLGLSFCNYNTVDVQFIGTANYQRLAAHDPLFWTSLLNTMIYTALVVPLGLTGSLLLAVLLNQNIRGRSVFRAMFYIPTLVPAVASSLLWLYMFNRDYGLLNRALVHVGIAGPDWLHSTFWSKPSLVMMSLWGIGGGRMIIFLAGLQGVPTSMYEAASIDGANRLQQFRHVTLPMLTPVIFFNAILGCIGAFQVFTEAYVLTKGGPDYSTLFYALYLFEQAFQQFHLGYASALAWILFLILALITAFQFWLGRKWVHYE